jgi:hypothetical protein
MTIAAALVMTTHTIEVRDELRDGALMGRCEYTIPEVLTPADLVTEIAIERGHVIRITWEQDWQKPGTRVLHAKVRTPKQKSGRGAIVERIERQEPAHLAQPASSGTVYVHRNYYCI